MKTRFSNACLAHCLMLPLLLLAAACVRPKDAGLDHVAVDTAFVDSIGFHHIWPAHFDPRRIAGGDSVGSLVVSRLEVGEAHDSTAVGTASFTGKLHLTGQMMDHPDPEARAVCFEADPLTASRLPRWQGDLRRPWFCFTNRDEATQLLSPIVPGRMYKVVIEDFTIHRGLSDQVNTARLTQVVSHSP